MDGQRFKAYLCRSLGWPCCGLHTIPVLLQEPGRGVSFHRLLVWLWWKPDRGRQARPGLIEPDEAPAHGTRSSGIWVCGLHILAQASADHFPITERPDGSTARSPRFAMPAFGGGF